MHNLRFDVRDAARLDEPGRYDLVCTFDAVRFTVTASPMLTSFGGIFSIDTNAARTFLPGFRCGVRSYSNRLNIPS